tara:strand:+ start:125 stop:523 length:399 start_codon:yes stop_codon:yes gene_type:complete
MLELRVKDRGRRLNTLLRLKTVLENLSLPFQIEDVVDVGDEIVVTFDADEEAILQALITVVFRQTPDGRELFSRSAIRKRRAKRARAAAGKFKKDDPATEKNEAWEGGKAPTKKKSAPRKKATKKKAPAKKK